MNIVLREDTSTLKPDLLLQCALNVVSFRVKGASLKGELGDLDRVTRVVKELGVMNSGPDFTDQPRVMSGASHLLVQLHGERGRHARSAVGTSSRPLGVAVGIIVEVE